MATTLERRREYARRPEVVEKRRAYRRRPEVAAKLAAAQKTPAYYEYQREYAKRPEVRARKNARARSPEARAVRLERRRELEAGWDEERRAAEVRRDNLRRLYGITHGAFVALESAQGGLCAICRRPERQMDRGRVRRLSVDHDHSTGTVRGLLCGSCNRALGYFNDDPSVLANAIEYLRR